MKSKNLKQLRRLYPIPLGFLFNLSAASTIIRIQAGQQIVFAGDIWYIGEHRRGLRDI